MVSVAVLASMELAVSAAEGAAGVAVTSDEAAPSPVVL